jgi:hypothetical protein
MTTAPGSNVLRCIFPARTVRSSSPIADDRQRDAEVDEARDQLLEQAAFVRPALEDHKGVDDADESPCEQCPPKYFQQENAEVALDGFAHRAALLIGFDSVAEEDGAQRDQQADPPGEPPHGAAPQGEDEERDGREQS